MRNRDYWKTLLPIITAWCDGQQIQWRWKSQQGLSNAWYDVDSTTATIAWGSDKDYRIKPASIKYRRYLYKLGGGVCMGSLTDHPDCSKPSQIQQEFYFIKWIDTEWQEYELPVNTEAGG